MLMESSKGDFLDEKNVRQQMIEKLGREGNHDANHMLQEQFHISGKMFI